MLAEVRLSRSASRRVLNSGLAGTPVRTRSAVLYEQERVERLVTSRSVPWSEVLALSPAGVFVARRDVLVTRPRAEQVATLAAGWSGLSPWRRLALHLQLVDYGRMPFIATIAGCVAFGAEIVATGPQSSFVLEEPGEWFGSIDRCWLPTGRGRPWVLHLGPFAPARIAS